MASLKAAAQSPLNMAHFLALVFPAEKALPAETLTKQGHAQALPVEILTNGSTSSVHVSSGLNSMVTLDKAYVGSAYVFFCKQCDHSGCLCVGSVACQILPAMPCDYHQVDLCNAS